MELVAFILMSLFFLKSEISLLFIRCGHIHRYSVSFHSHFSRNPHNLEFRIFSHRFYNGFKLVTQIIDQQKASWFKSFCLYILLNY